jgi:hypothetical protein
MRKFISVLGFAIAISAAQIGLARAADIVEVPDIPQEPLPVAPAYNGSLSLYGWLPFMNGDVGVNYVDPVDISLTPHEILEILDFTVMATGDLRFGPFGVFGDFIYLKVSNGAATPGPFFSTADLTTQVTIGTLAGTYQFIETDEGWLQGLAGGRYWGFDNQLDLGANILPAISLSDEIHWVDPVVGLRGYRALSDQWYLSGAGLIGGFGVGSEFMWDVFGGVGYKFTDSISLTMGYRAFGVDYSDDGDVIDLVNHGPLVGLTFRF